MAVLTTIEMKMNTNDLQRLRDLGRYYLQANKIDQALQTYVALLNDFPNDVGSIIILGDSYLMAGDPSAAKDLYQVALDFEPDRLDIQHRVQLAGNTASAEVGIAGGFPPLHPQAVNRLIERLTGKPAIFDEQQINRAAELLEKTIHGNSPASNVSENLEEIDALLPAILELNIRQARAEGRADLAAELQDLQNSLLRDRISESTFPEFPPTVEAGANLKKETVRVMLVGEPSSFSPFRLRVIADSLKQVGFSVIENWDELSMPWEGVDVVIAHNPHLNPVCMKSIAAWVGAGRPVVVDMDTDFKAFNGEASPETRAFIAALELAHIITFPSNRSALKFASHGYKAFTVPDGWSQKNSLWLKNAPQTGKLSLGLFSQPGCAEEAASIRRAIIRILREFPQTRLVISGDPDAYPLFDSISDTRRVYLPPADVDDYPYLLAQVDIHLMPSLENSDSCLETDRRLMEAGIRKSTWVASPTPASEGWGAGGCIARSVDDWYSHLKTLILDEELRTRLGMEGHQKALEREAGRQSELWAAVARKAIAVCNKQTATGEGE